MTFNGMPSELTLYTSRLYTLRFKTRIAASLLGLFIYVFSIQVSAQKNLNYKLLETQAHDHSSFTQGLIIENQHIYESSGLYGKSFVRVYDAKTNKTLRQQNLPKNRFAEGLTKYKNELFLLTWMSGLLYTLDADTFETKQITRYQGEGWGLTHNGKHFIMSNGSSHLYYRNLSSFKIEKSIQVKINNSAIKHLNELEYANGAIWANVWQSPYILKISESGEVLARADLSKLKNKQSKRRFHKVLNGIAYDTKRKAFWITGKNWSKRYLIQFEP